MSQDNYIVQIVDRLHDKSYDYLTATDSIRTGGRRIFIERWLGARSSKSFELCCCRSEEAAIELAAELRGLITSFNTLIILERIKGAWQVTYNYKGDRKL